MQQYIITVDTGTTNTRVVLWDMNQNIVALEKKPIGVRNTAIDGNNLQLKFAVKSSLEALLEKIGITYANIKRIIASGMISSNVGLVEIPHCIAPVDAVDLANATTAFLLPEVCPLPIWVIPGVKNSDDTVTLENYEAMDIMRGEEVESIAIIEHFPKGKPILLILPGSHTKFVAINAQSKIAACLTSITGELLASITNNTIISDAVGHCFVTEESYDKDMLLIGYQNAKKVGFGRAVFSCRILNQFYTKDKTKLANYILGATLQNDITAIKNSDALCHSQNSTVIVSGKSPLRQALVDILEFDSSFEKIEAYLPEDDLPLSALGAYLISNLCP